MVIVCVDVELLDAELSFSIRLVLDVELLPSTTEVEDTELLVLLPANVLLELDWLLSVLVWLDKLLGVLVWLDKLVVVPELSFSARLVLLAELASSFTDVLLVKVLVLELCSATDVLVVDDVNDTESELDVKLDVWLDVKLDVTVD